MAESTPRGDYIFIVGLGRTLQPRPARPAWQQLAVEKAARGVPSLSLGAAPLPHGPQYKAQAWEDSHPRRPGSRTAKRAMEGMEGGAH